MKKFLLPAAAVAVVAIMSCGGEQPGAQQPAQAPASETQEANPKGIGITEVKLTEPLEASMLVAGKSIYEMKCSACHKLDAMRVVGPGFQGVTDRRRPEWIMNMITNTEVMLGQDPEAQKLLEECLTRMPNQNLSTGDARAILEYMRQNDEEKTGKRDGAAKS